LILWPQGYGLRHYPELDSTNVEASRLAAAGESGPLWIRADRQTAGRGRRGRSWESLSGNLAATLLLTPERPQSEWPQLSFAAAIATADMAGQFAPAVDIAVKWPNDILANGKKLAGILLERAGDSLAIGIGVNLARFPEGTEFPATSMVALGAKPPEAEAALTALAGHLAKWYEVWRGQGFTPLRDAWLARAAGLGARIRARLPEAEIQGVFEGIDAGGALLLKEGTKTRAISAGEVFFG
jgi:BirA family transcriptional regulator, biotin operon repressor / biotin---[acetyl-CoA-carboxylase] ligase